MISAETVQKLRFKCRREHLQIKYLAAETGISAATIGSALNGRRPMSMNTYCAICAVLSKRGEQNYERTPGNGARRR